MKVYRIIGWIFNKPIIEEGGHMKTTKKPVAKKAAKKKTKAKYKK